MFGIRSKKWYWLLLVVIRRGQGLGSGTDNDSGLVRVRLQPLGQDSLLSGLLEPIREISSFHDCWVSQCTLRKTQARPYIVSTNLLGSVIKEVQESLYVPDVRR